MWNDLLIEVKDDNLTDFLETLSPRTLATMWVRSCELENYPIDSAFNMDDLWNSIRLNPEYFGITLIEGDYSISDVDNELKEYLKQS